MKKTITCITLFLSLTLIFALISPLKISATTKEDDVSILQDLNLLDKEGNTKAKLDAALTRAEGLAMVLKALGYSQEKVNIDQYAILNKFTDVPDWFKGYAAIGLDLKIATGKTDELFDPQGTLTKHEFLTFVLRALKYDGTKAWQDADELAKDNELIRKDVNIDTPITKREASSIILNALSAQMQVGTDSQTLAGILVSRKAVSEEKALKYGIKLVFDKSKEEVQKIFIDNGWYAYIMKDFQLQMTPTTKATKAILAIKDDSTALFIYSVMPTEEDAKRLVAEGAEAFKVSLLDSKTGIGDEHKKFFYNDFPMSFVRKGRIIFFTININPNELKTLSKKLE